MFTEDESEMSGTLDYYAEAIPEPVAMPDVADTDTEPVLETALETAPAATDPLDAPGWSLEGLDKPSLLDAPPVTDSTSVNTDDRFAQYGGIDSALSTLNVVNQLISGEETGVTNFLQTMYDVAQPAYAALVNQVLEYNQDYAIHVLKEKGLIPDLTGAPVVADNLGFDAETLESIPADLRDIALKQPRAVQEDLNLMTPEVRNMALQEKQELAAVRQYQQEQRAAAERAQYENAINTGIAERDALLTRLEQGHRNILDKWSPYGQDAKEDNAALSTALLEGSMRQVLEDPKFAEMYNQINHLITQAPLLDLQGNKMAATANKNQAHALAAQFNLKYSQVLQGQVARLDKVFRASRAASSPTSTPRREITGSVYSDGQKVSALGPDGRATDDYLRSLAASITTQ